ncbi:MAG TPA: TIGR00296 family protein [Thermoplasmata archaeon]|nr:TIGR00296 family protein [Thermoplasmata archaeon]
MLSDPEGEVAVRLARKTIETLVGDRKKPTMPAEADIPKSFAANAGCFTTLHTFPARDLRGCIGIPGPEYPLVKAIVTSATEATQDPRFPPLSAGELGSVIVEVSVLTPPEEIKWRLPKDLLEQIRLGTDGLIIRRNGFSGLFLPQVPVEQSWDVDQYLINLCYKAGLYADEWARNGSRIYRFQSEIFGELEPRGKVARHGPTT